ncbi:hypothetical protein [Aequorivita marina]|uniref:hypothetical protein n=1 Tax=Aequorivita marina TaxID=3073654 RepID=UPI0028740326|nr:hypothetical protein [Aequorivita sp. S2608]MDS1297445.1 hypothetical protein [Aequorivita sp. S2608]
MEKNKKFEEIFDDYTFTERVESSLKGYSNWLLGVSIGLAAVLISLSSKNENIPWYFILPLISVFGGILYSGFIKREIFIREIKMNVAFGELKKIKILREAKEQATLNTNDKADLEKWNIIFTKYWAESEKLSRIGKSLDWSSRLTFLNVIIIGIVVIYIIAKNACQ